MYLSIFIVTSPLLAANARGEGAGNGTVLQKIATPSGTLTLLSGQSIRRAVRENMIAQGAKMWRTHGTSDTPSGYGYGEQQARYQTDADPSADENAWDDVPLFGYFIPKGKGNTVAKRRSSVSVSTGISLTPYLGERYFGQGVNEANSGTSEARMMPINGEHHYTQYGFFVTINLRELKARPSAVKHLLKALTGMQVGGNHAAHATEVVPELSVWRFHMAPGQSGFQALLGEADLPSIQGRLSALGLTGQRVAAPNAETWAQVKAWAESRIDAYFEGDVSWLQEQA